MKTEFIPYEHALALKELGFKETCFTFFTEEGDLYESEGWGYTYGKNVLGNEVSAPLYQQVFRWFREKYNLLSFIDDNRNDEYRYVIFEKTPLLSPKWFNTYEEAEQACLEKLIEIVKNKNGEKS